jgi:hypothetical protein
MKSACDGVVVTLKRLAAKAACSAHTMISHQLYEWDHCSKHHLNFDFVTENE